MILATTVVLALTAVGTARRASVKAAETRRASEILEGVLTATPVKPGTVSGSSGGFDWRIETRLANLGANVPKVALCQRSAQAAAVQTGRRYALATAALCAAPEAGG